jgi:hypothetical protein
MRTTTNSYGPQSPFPVNTVQLQLISRAISVYFQLPDWNVEGDSSGYEITSVKGLTKEHCGDSKYVVYVTVYHRSLTLYTV